MPKKTQSIFLFMCFLLLCLFAVCLRFPPTEREEDGYTVGIYNGRVAVFSGNDAEPVSICDVYAAALPEADRQKLAEGIPVPDEKALHDLLEDYDN